MKRVVPISVCSVATMVSVLLSASNCAAQRTSSAEMNKQVIARWKYSFESLGGDEISLIGTGPERYGAVMPGLAGTDDEGRFYLIDRNHLANGEYGAVRVFTRNGQQVRVLQDPRFNDPRGAIRVGVTSRGYLWVAKTSRVFIREHPAVTVWVYAPNSSDVVADYYRKLPKSLAECLADKLGANWYNRSDTVCGPAPVRAMYLCGDKAVLYLTQRLLNTNKGGFFLVDHYLRVTMSEDGEQLLDCRVVDCVPRRPFVAPDGEEMSIEIEGRRDGKHVLDLTEPWKLLLWPSGQDAKPLEVLSSQVAQRLFDSRERIYAQVVGADKKRRTYIVLSTQGRVSPQPQQTVTEGGKLVYVRADGKHVTVPVRVAYVLVVVNPSGRIVAESKPVCASRYLPARNWVQPLPDGGGYYELRLLEREAQVVFHPLP